MHAALALVVLNVALATKVLGASVVIYAALQAIKKVWPQVGGWWAIALNVALSILAVLVVTPVDQLWTTGTLIAIITAGAAAAGIHGTVRSLSAPTDVGTTTKKTT